MKYPKSAIEFLILILLIACTSETPSNLGLDVDKIQKDVQNISSQLNAIQPGIQMPSLKNEADISASDTEFDRHAPYLRPDPFQPEQTFKTKDPFFRENPFIRQDPFKRKPYCPKEEICPN